LSALLELFGRLVDVARSLPKARRDQKRKETLRELLSKEHIKWVSIETLAEAVGASEQDTKDLLTAIGARGSVGERKGMWALKSRVDKPDEKKPPVGDQ
jgi:hypothetical protein